MEYLNYINREFSEPVLQKLREKISEDYNDAWDVIQEAMLVVLEKPEVFLIDLYNRKKLRTYILSTIYLTTKHYNSKFNIAKRKKSMVLSTDNPDFNITLADQEPQDSFYEEKAIEAAAQLNEYELNILELYSQLGSVRLVANKIGVHYTNVYHTVKYCKQFIKSKIKVA